MNDEHAAPPAAGSAAGAAAGSPAGTTTTPAGRAVGPPADPPADPPAGVPREPLLAGFAMGLLSTAWLAIMGAAGWLHDPARLQLHAVVIVLQIVVLAGMFVRTRDRDYGGQVRLGLLASAIGSLVLFLGVVVVLTFVFPDHFEQLRVARFEVLVARGMSADEANELLDGIAGWQSPTAQGITATMGTLATGFITSLLIPVAARRRT